MKCDCLLHKKKLKNGREKIDLWLSPARIVAYGWATNNLAGKEARYNTDPFIESDLERCDGNIIANIKAVDDPYYGGCSATLEIEYKCNKCGFSGYEEFPKTDNDLSDWLTQLIASGPDEIRQDFLSRLIAQKKRNDEYLAKAKKEMEDWGKRNK